VSQGSSAAEWKAHWGLALAAFAGLSLHSVTTFSMGLFVEPLEAEFGWGRAQIMVGSLMGAISMIILAPMIGALIDRWGSRRLAISGVLVTSAAICGFSLANGSFVQWAGLWLVYIVASLGAKTTVWTSAVSSVFSAGRGVALGVTLAGAALAQTFAPPIANYLIDAYGWRGAFIWLGIGWGTPTLLLVLVFLFDAHDKLRREKSEKRNPYEGMGGLTLQEAMRSKSMIMITFSTFFLMLVGIGVSVHQVPILTSVGVERTTAAWLAGLAGAAALAGKVGTGFLLDRMHGGFIGGLTMSVSSISFVLLLEPFRTPVTIVLAMLILGYAAGAKLQISAFLTPRYCGMRHFGKIFGVVYIAIAAGSGLGPVIAGYIHDVTGSYDPLIIAGIPLTLMCGVMLMQLGPYPEYESPAEPAAG
jgi:MFS family permease